MNGNNTEFIVKFYKADNYWDFFLFLSFNIITNLKMLFKEI